MIQDIEPYKFDNAYKNIKPTEQDYVLFFDNSQILVRLEEENGGNKIIFPSVKEFGIGNDYTYLFSIDDMRFFMCDNEELLPEGYELTDVRKIRDIGVSPMYSVFAVMTGKHLADWYRDTKYCGRCSGKTVHSDKERAKVCPQCGYTIYPRIMPAVIVGVKNGEKLLLTKYRTGLGYNALIAGFTEIGETLEETVEREVMEESGLKIKNIRYYKTQPWGLANDILIGYYCEVDGDDKITMDENELKEARWVERNEIELQPGNYSLTNEMMKMFKEGKIR